MFLFIFISSQKQFSIFINSAPQQYYEKVANIREHKIFFNIHSNFEVDYAHYYEQLVHL